MDQIIVELFVDVDNFATLQTWSRTRSLPNSKRTNQPGLHVSEIATITLLSCNAGMRNFKLFYQWFSTNYRSYFPKMPSYERFVILKKRVLGLLAVYLQKMLVQDQSITFIDSTKLEVCRPIRHTRHRVWKGLATFGKTGAGFFFGLKMHLAINVRGELTAVQFTKGNVDDRRPVLQMMRGLQGFLVGDKGYLSHELSQKLRKKKIKLVTPLKKKMKPAIRPYFEAFLLKKRSLIETVIGKLKQSFELVHSRHRSMLNGLIHFLAVLISYQRLSSKPSIELFTHS